MTSLVTGGQLTAGKTPFDSSGRQHDRAQIDQPFLYVVYPHMEFPTTENFCVYHPANLQRQFEEERLRLIYGLLYRMTGPRILIFRKWESQSLEAQFRKRG